MIELNEVVEEAFNRTIEELKYLKRKYANNNHTSFNRTIEELKLIQFLHS